MKEDTRRFSTQLAVVGSGIAGFAASIFAANRKISVAQAGNTGAIAYTTGYLDLYGQRVGSKNSVSNPWQELKKLKTEEPTHPLGKLATADIKKAFEEFTTFLTEGGIAYSNPQQNNLTALTPAGTLKPTLSIPRTMSAGAEALASKSPCLIVDFKGLKGFSGRQVVANLVDQWPDLQTKRIIFPEMQNGEIYPEVMARSLEVPAARKRLAVELKKAAGSIQVIGMPAVLGMHNPDFIRKELENLTGMTIFEIPTMPPSVPGIRLREMFEQVLPQKGVTLIPQQKVKKISFSADKAHLMLTDNYGRIEIKSDTVLLATGRFLSGGLEAEMPSIREPLLDIPITQPSSRTDWYGEKYISEKSHPLHRAGIETDSELRPVDTVGKIINKRLFAAGAILAHQDWIRERCGAGIAIATAFHAVQAINRYINR